MKWFESSRLVLDEAQKNALLALAGDKPSLWDGLDEEDVLGVLITQLEKGVIDQSITRKPGLQHHFLQWLASHQCCTAMYTQNLDFSSQAGKRPLLRLHVALEILNGVAFFVDIEMPLIKHASLQCTM